MERGQGGWQRHRNHLHPIKSEATRIAALLSGEVDMVRDTSIQDLARIKANPSSR